MWLLPRHCGLRAWLVAYRAGLFARSDDEERKSRLRFRPPKEDGGEILETTFGSGCLSTLSDHAPTPSLSLTCLFYRRKILGQ